jgi:hypothetical protein
MSAEKLSSHWVEAGRLIGFRVDAPYLLRLTDGSTIRFAARLPDFGNEMGMLLAYNFDEIKRDAAEIVACGYGYSVLGPYVDDVVDRDGVIEVLQDWGWTASTRAPKWLL